MRAIVLTPGTISLRIEQRLEPELASGDDVMLRVLRVGICGTDREEARGGRAAAPDGEDSLVVGHEMLGRVEATGAQVTSLKAGDYATFTVRRECGNCPACDMRRSDMCYTGDYADRGIKRRHGYQTEFVVDSERYAVKVPESIASIGVLAEPMSIAEKAIDEALTLQASRLPDFGDRDSWMKGRLALVAGLGPIGLLAAIVLRLRGAEVLGLDIVDDESPRARLLTRIGGRYVDGRETSTSNIGDVFGEIELIFEATGVPRLEFDLLSSLARNGLYLLTGIPGGERPISTDGAAIMRGLVLGNQMVVGSVNASRHHFDLGVRDLELARKTWGDTIDQLITHRRTPDDFKEAFEKQPEDEIKTIIEWS